MPHLLHGSVFSYHIQLQAFTLYNINELFIISERMGSLGDRQIR